MLFLLPIVEPSNIMRISHSYRLKCTSIDTLGICFEEKMKETPYIGRCTVQVYYNVYCCKEEIQVEIGRCTVYFIIQVYYNLDCC